METVGERAQPEAMATDTRDRGAKEAPVNGQESPFRSLFEGSAEAHVLFKKGVIVDCNRAAMALLGYTRRKHVLALSLSQISPPLQANGQSSDAFFADVQAVLSKEGRHRFECLRCRADGTAFPVEVVLTAVSLDGEPFVHAIWRDITDRVKTEEALRDSEERFKQQMVTELERQLERIGRDLHDGLGQLLTGIRMMSEQLATKLDHEADGLGERAAKIAGYAKEALTQTQAIYQGLVPVQLSREGLQPALLNLAEHTWDLNGVPVVLHYEAPRLAHGDETTVLHLYRIAQEAVSNAVKHGQASQVVITVWEDERQTVLRIDDNGQGFEPQETTTGPSLGLDSIHYRASLIGGTVTIHSTAGRGTTVLCLLPPQVENPSS